MSTLTLRPLMPPLSLTHRQYPSVTARNLRIGSMFTPDRVSGAWTPILISVSLTPSVEPMSSPPPAAAGDPPRAWSGDEATVDSGGALLSLGPAAAGAAPDGLV